MKEKIIKIERARKEIQKNIEELLKDYLEDGLHKLLDFEFQEINYIPKKTKEQIAELRKYNKSYDEKTDQQIIDDGKEIMDFEVFMRNMKIEAFDKENKL